MKKLIGVVGEGPTDYLVLKTAIDRITGEENSYRRIQPEPDMQGEFGNGWKGVWKWCEDAADNLDIIFTGIVPNLDLIIIQMDGDVARKEKEIHCLCSTTKCRVQGKISPLKCEKVKAELCPVDIPCTNHNNAPDGYMEHTEKCIQNWLGENGNRKNVIITIPCDSTDAWIVAAYENFSNVESIKNPWEDIISKKKEYHGIRIPGHKKSVSVYQKFLGKLGEQWNSVVQKCPSAKKFEDSIREQWNI